MDFEQQKNEKISDNDLVIAVLAGDQAAFASLVDRHLPALYQFAYRYMRSAHDAEDVAQEAFVRAWKHLKKFDDTKNFKTWLFAIAKNAALDMIKKKKPLLFSQIGEEEGKLDTFLAPYVADLESPDIAFERALVKSELAEALAALPAAYRTVLGMRYNDNLKFREIAAALGEPIDTVKSKHRRGLALMRKIVGGEAAEA
jgi:RNA polymerase sigma-70 factor, ECF subfamily